ncbi:family 43 glycosylhydrolase [Enterococcus sp. DIV0187]|uniref:family 43 glycosylhydrolase n=1 Tax=Enterococcus sp. DIV0187 TaxID=2774644 RepID=UPI003F29B1EA
MKKEIVLDEPWFDNHGERIQAHGGSVKFFEGKYYFFGENKTDSKANSGIWHQGVNCYSSEDLINWTFENTILKPSDDISNPLHPTRIMDRPHIIYNKKNQEFVMWVKLVGSDENPRDWNQQFMGIATSKSITGDFELVNRIVPLEMSSGDFDLFVDEDERAYLIFGKVHTEIVIADLTEDYKNITGKYSTHLHFAGPPLAREAPAVFKREGEYFMITSGTTAYYPNPSLTAKANNIHGPWYIIGDPCVDDLEKNSFNSQISSVLKVEGKDLYIAIGDRWVVDLSKPIEKSSWKINTSISEYVWLPIHFEKGNPLLKWQKKWKPDLF